MGAGSFKDFRSIHEDQYRRTSTVAGEAIDTVGGMLCFDITDGKLYKATNAANRVMAGIVPRVGPGIKAGDKLTAVQGIFEFANDGTVTKAHYGKHVYVGANGYTVSATKGAGVVAGKVIGLATYPQDKDSAGVDIPRNEGVIIDTTTNADYSDLYEAKA